MFKNSAPPKNQIKFTAIIMIRFKEIIVNVFFKIFFGTFSNQIQFPSKKGGANIQFPKQKIEALL